MFNELVELEEGKLGAQHHDDVRRQVKSSQFEGKQRMEGVGKKQQG